MEKTINALEGMTEKEKRLDQTKAKERRICEISLKFLNSKQDLDSDDEREKKKLQNKIKQLDEMSIKEYDEMKIVEKERINKQFEQFSEIFDATESDIDKAAKEKNNPYATSSDQPFVVDEEGTSVLGINATKETP